MKEIKFIQAVRNFYAHQTAGTCLKIFDDQDQYQYISQVVLIRHGEPDAEKVRWYSRSKAIAYTKSYDLAGIRRFDSNPICTDSLKRVKIYHSTLERARHTASLIFGSKFDLIADARFKEFEKKVIPFFKIHMPLKFWTFLSRLLWFLGLNSRDIEHVKAAKIRAKPNASFLSREALGMQAVIVVAHGFHNRYVGRYLRKEGWVVVRKGGIGHLGVNIFARRSLSNQVVK